MSDLLDRTARQVRLPGGTVHALKSNHFAAGIGRCYSTTCGRQLHAMEGALLTTRPVGCTQCGGRGADPAKRAKEFVSAVLSNSEVLP